MSKVTTVQLTVDIDKLNPAEYNPQTISEEAKKGLKTSLEEFSLVEPVIVDENYLIIGGHKRWAIEKERGSKEIMIVQVKGLTDLQKKKLNITLNNPKIKGSYVPEKLAILLEELRFEDNFEELRLDELEAIAVPEPEFTAPIDAPESSEEEDDAQDYVPDSGIKMVQLLMRQGQHPEFMENIEELQKALRTDNLTDTVVEAVKVAYKTLVKA